MSTSKGRAAVDFPATTGRYVMLQWHPASVQGEAFSVAQVAAFGSSLHNRNVQKAGREQVTNENNFSDGKDFMDGKTILDNKDIPAEGPGAEAQPPSEGPPPPLPEVPPFTFIPQGVPEVPPISP